MNKSGKTDSYDVRVKYNDIDTSNTIGFKEFWNLEGTINNNTKIGDNYLKMDEETSFSIEVPYTGYLKIEGTFVWGGKIEIDGHDIRPFPTNEFAFEGEVKHSVHIESVGMEVCTFTKFSTTPYETSISEISQDFYGNVSVDNSEAYGELIFNNLCNKEHELLEWYSVDNDIVDNKMEFWSSEFIDNTGYINNTKAVPTASGYKELALSNIDKFPILIHKKDISKKNKIGPFIQEDGSEIYINLTII